MTSDRYLAEAVYRARTPPAGDDVSIAEMKRWTYDEFLAIERHVEADEAMLPSLAFLQGQPAGMIVDPTPRLITNWGGEGEGTGFSGRADPVAGTLSLPANGIYRVNCYIFMYQGSATQNEELTLFMRINGVFDQYIVAQSIATNKTINRTLVATWLQTFNANDTLALGLLCTTSLGSCSFYVASFEVETMAVARQ